MMLGVAAGPPYSYARHDRYIVVDELQYAGLRVATVNLTPAASPHDETLGSPHASRR